jgi:hypothetical protein
MSPFPPDNRKAWNCPEKGMFRLPQLFVYCGQNSWANLFFNRLKDFARDAND